LHLFGTDGVFRCVAKVMYLKSQNNLQFEMEEVEEKICEDNPEERFRSLNIV
jgi:hypothetical protein